MGEIDWQNIVMFLSVSSVILAPAIWFTRHQASKTEEMIKSITESQTTATDRTRADLREFRDHFDMRISEIYNSIDTKNRELREYINTEMTYVKNLISDLEVKIDLTREKNHELEKEFMRMRTDVHKEFVSKEQFDILFNMRTKSNADSN